jgi:hypothetical protein
LAALTASKQRSAALWLSASVIPLTWNQSAPWKIASQSKVPGSASLMTERVDLDHRRHDVPRDERIAHSLGRLDDAVADIGDHEVGRLAPRLEDAVRDLLDQPTEMKRARMPHPVGAFHEDLRLAKVILGPVHAQPERVPLEIDLAEALAAKPLSVELRCLFCRHPLDPLRGG